MAVKAISEFAIQPGRRDEFVRLFESLVAQHSEDMRAAGCHSTTLVRRWSSSRTRPPGKPALPFAKR